MHLVAANTRFRDIVTADAIDNAMALDVAMGGSTNTVLHVLALAREAGVDYPIARFNEVAERVAAPREGIAGVGWRPPVAHPGRARCWWRSCDPARAGTEAAASLAARRDER